MSRRARRTFFATTLVFFAVGLAETAMRLRAPARAAAEAMLGWCAVVATHEHARGKNGYSMRVRGVNWRLFLAIRRARWARDI